MSLKLRWNTNRVLLAQHELLTAQCAGLQTRAQQLEDDFCRSIDAIPSDSEITAGLRTGSAGDRADMVVLPQWLQREAAFDGALSEAARTQLDKIAGLSPEQLARWVASHESLIHELVDSADPVMVAAWAERVNQHPGLLATLIATGPLLMGGLDGLHPTVRAAANVNVARERLAKNEAKIAGLGEPMRDLKKWELLTENDYLQRAIDGKVQLYLFDPDRDRIIEMFGNPATATSRLNWVPGTTTTLDNFYDSFVTDLPSRIAEIEGNSLVFVLKDGKFPQLNDLDATPANTELMNELGSRVARFELGMDAAGFADQHTVAVGHSAGLSIVTAAETHGAGVDTLISLSGAGMNSGWVSNPNTTYYDLTPDVDVIRGVRSTAGLAETIADGWAGYPRLPESENGFVEIDPGIGRDLDSFNIVEDVLLAPGPGLLAVEGVANHLAIPSKDTSDVVTKGIVNALRGKELEGMRRDGK